MKWSRDISSPLKMTQPHTVMLNLTEEEDTRRGFSCGSAGEGPPIVSERVWVRTLDSLSGLRIWRGHTLWRRSQMQLGSGVAMAVAQASAVAPILPLA